MNFKGLDDEEENDDNEDSGEEELHDNNLNGMEVDGPKIVSDLDSDEEPSL